MDLNRALPFLAQHPSARLDLAAVALALARDEYPRLDINEPLALLADWAEQLQPRLRGSLREQVELLSHFLFAEQGFQGNTTAYYDARNSYFNQVLQRRLGIPLTLTLLAMSVGKRAGLTIGGVGLPGHFVARASAGEEEILFDPFHKGRLLTPADCETLVQQTTGQSFHATPAALAPTSPQQIVVRLLTNLKGIYLHQGEFARAVVVMQRLVQILPADPWQQRDLGVVLLRTGQPAAALDHLEAYLEAVPQASDAAMVRELLLQARTAILPWN